MSKRAVAHASVCIAILGASATACSKPAVPAEWRDLLPVEGMKKPSEGDWVLVGSGKPSPGGRDQKNRAGVVGRNEAEGFGSGYDGNHAVAWYSHDQLTPAALKAAVAQKVTAAGYKLLVACDDSNAVVGAKAGNAVVSAAIDELTGTMLSVQLWKGSAGAVTLPAGAKCEWTKDAFGDDEAHSLCEWGRGMKVCPLKKD